MNLWIDRYLRGNTPCLLREAINFGGEGGFVYLCGQLWKSKN